REIDVVHPPLIPFLYPERVLRARRRRAAGRYAPEARPARLPPELWPVIAERARYESLRDLAAEYGVSHETIRAIVPRRAAAQPPPPAPRARRRRGVSRRSAGSPSRPSRWRRPTRRRPPAPRPRPRSSTGARRWPPRPAAPPPSAPAAPSAAPGPPARTARPTGAP